MFLEDLKSFTDKRGHYITTREFIRYVILKRKAEWISPFTIIKRLQRARKEGLLVARFNRKTFTYLYIVNRLKLRYFLSNNLGSKSSNLLSYGR